MLGVCQNIEGQMRLKLRFLPIKENGMSGANPTPLTPRTLSPQWSMVVAASCCGDVFHQQGLENWSDLKEWWIVLNTGKFLRETCFSLTEIWDWEGGSPSSRTMTLSILLKQHLSGLRGNLNVLEWSGLSPDLNPIENLWYDWSGILPTWRSWSSFALKNGQKSQWLNVPSL